ncbi:MAG: cold shock domain-containing protein [Candidatus Nanohaloarchaea archaeon]|nr:cold shock domain-containing protein [Candidatus Nanohaloarchaea archaeon]
MKGTVDFYHDQKGYGFIKPEGAEGDDVFFHISEVEGDEVTEGDEVEFETVEGDKGPEAVEVRLV